MSWPLEDSRTGKTHEVIQFCLLETCEQFKFSKDHVVFPGGSVSKDSACNTGDQGSIPESERSPEKEMATYSSILSWRIPCTEEPVGLQFMSSLTLYIEGLTFCILYCNDHVKKEIYEVQFSSVTHSCPSLCGPMDCSTPGFPVHHQLTEFTQTHVHQVGDAIKLSHPLSSPSLRALNTSQH